MAYEAIKGFHMLAVLVWLIDLLVVGAMLAGSPRYSTIITLRRWDRRIGTPAMILVWLLGLTLAVEGGWFVAGWLHAKLLLVILLSALHGMQTGTLRRMAADPNKQVPGFLKASAPITLVVVACILFLVVAKPF
jgi:putative membrane protein